MPGWGWLLIGLLAGWLVVSPLFALAVGRAIRIADERDHPVPPVREPGDSCDPLDG